VVTVYLASRSEDRNHIQQVAKQLRSKGISITSGWLRYGGMAYQHLDRMSEADAWRLVATNDLSDVDAADLVAVFSPVKALKIGTGGRHIEFGYAYGTGKPIVLVGKPGTVFHYLPGVHHVPKEKDLAAFILSGVWRNKKKRRMH
jgi:nucleoside 2-deoxyribosyltransferase